MSEKKTLNKEIEEYLSGELSPDLIAEFERRIREDENLQKELEISNKVISGIRGYAFKEMLKRFHAELFNDDGTPKGPDPNPDYLTFLENS